MSSVSRTLAAALLALPVLSFVPGLSSDEEAGAPAVDARAGTYEVDALHSSALFRVGHLGVAEFYGMFNELGGSYVLDPKDPARCSILLAIEPRSIDTRHPGRDAHALNEDFLHVEEHGEMTFRSTKVAAADEPGHFAVTGELTLRGVTRVITVEARLVGAADTRMGYRSGMVAEFAVDRFDFGMSGLPEEALGRMIHFTVSLEGMLK